MTPFLLLFIILIVSTIIFYIGWFSMFYYWHERKETYVVVPVLFTFEFFITGFLIISLLSIILQYVPDLLKLVSSS